MYLTIDVVTSFLGTRPYCVARQDGETRPAVNLIGTMGSRGHVV